MYTLASLWELGRCIQKVNSQRLPPPMDGLALASIIKHTAYYDSRRSCPREASIQLQCRLHAKDKRQEDAEETESEFKWWRCL